VKSISKEKQRLLVSRTIIHSFFKTVMKTPRANSAALSTFRYNLRKRVTKSDATRVEHGILNCVLVQ